MFKSVYCANGTLIAPLLKFSSLALVDFVLYTALNTALSSGDWTYLKIQDQENTEIVKVIRANNGSLGILRGIEGTIPNTFLMGTKVTYEDTASAILDQLSLVNLALIGINGVTVNGSTINYPEITLLGLGGIEIVANHIEENILVKGCCSLLAETAPPVPNPLQPIVTDDDDYLVTEDDDFLIWV